MLSRQGSSALQFHAFIVQRSSSVIARFCQAYLCFTVSCLYRPMFVFSCPDTFAGVVMLYSLMPLSSDVAFSNRGFLPRIVVLNMFMALSSDVRLK